jgi:acyl carrier protein
MRDKLIALIEDQADFRPVTPDMSFEQIGMDSLDYAELIAEVRHQVGPITTKQAQACWTVGELLAVFG